MKELVLALFLLSPYNWAQSSDELDLLDQNDMNLLLEEDSGQTLDLSEFEEVDDLESLKNDVGEDPLLQSIQQEEKEAKVEVPKIDQQKGPVEQELKQVKKEAPKLFDVGQEEERLLELSKFVEGKISNEEWDSIAASAKVDRYVVQKDDWLWKISEKLFGTGFYYSKIWALNPYITNPHLIEPGMVLVFNTGSPDTFPQVQVSSFGKNGGKGSGQVYNTEDYIDFESFGEGVKPSWIEERKRLQAQGSYFEYGSNETLDDLKQVAEDNLKKEYKKYTPPIPNIVIKEPGAEYDNTGFDKSAKITFDYKEGFFLNTFVTTNVVQDLGQISDVAQENIFIQKFDKVYVKFNADTQVKPGDFFSVYVPGGVVEHSDSERKGYKYTIGAQVKVISKKSDKWECEVFELSGLVQRGDRITVYTPKIGKIVKTFNQRNLEAAIIGSYKATAGGLSFGDVVYLDRGRADGVEMGTVFETYGFLDKGTEKKITNEPTYKTGELTVISLTDNFSTALVTNSSNVLKLGTLAMSKTQDKAILDAKVKNKSLLRDVSELEAKALDELDVELNLDDLSKNLLDKADQLQLTDDELEELERQEREKSIIKDHEEDLKELDELENEVLNFESQVNEANIDQDKLLEQQNLNSIESQNTGKYLNEFGPINDVEDEIGLKYMDESLNSKDNPYGLTEYDVEEIDEMLNKESSK